MIEIADVASQLDYVILGGGILGTTLAALAARAGRKVLVLRMSDETAPRADTLRNQGWLQSGLMYDPRLYVSPDDFRVAITSAFYNGPRLLRMCGMQRSKEQGILQAFSQERIDRIRETASLLKLNDRQFREIGFDEARDMLGEQAERDATFFAIPDTPFDEAGVMEELRTQAWAHGAVFWELDSPAEVAEFDGNLQIYCDGETLVSPLTFVAAGAGILRIFEKISDAPNPFTLRFTPLMVHYVSSQHTAPVYVNVDKGFSSVRHRLKGNDECGFVTGTRENHIDVQRDPNRSRQISPDEIASFKNNLSEQLILELAGARITGGCELISDGIPLVEPWLKDMGNVVFGSPGRATVALRVAEDAFKMMEANLTENGHRRFGLASAKQSRWDGAINMHYAPAYSFDDAPSVH